MARRQWLVVSVSALLLSITPLLGQEEMKLEPPPPPEVPKAETLLPPSIDEILAGEKAEGDKAAPAEKKEEKKAEKTSDAAVARIAVMRFENATDNVSGANVAHSAPTMLVTLLSAQQGLAVVERELLDKVVEEINLGTTGLIQGRAAVKMGQLLSAPLLLTGSVQEASYDRQTIKAYKINSVKDIYRVVMLIRLVDTSTGRVIMAEKAEKQEEEVITKYTQPRPGNRFTELAENALKEIVPTIAERAKSAAKEDKKDTELYTLKVVSVPEEADVEVDGVFEGNCPVEVELEPGVHDVKVGLPGYETWEYKVRLRKRVQVIKARLRPKPTSIEVQVKEK